MGVLGAMPALVVATGTMGATPGEHAALALVFGGAALGTAFVGRRAPARGLLAPRHAGLALALVALAAALGTLGAVMAALASLAWAWSHRSVLALPEGTTAREARRARARILTAAAIGGAPSALWAAPIALDGPSIVEDVLWSGCSRWQRILVTTERGAIRLWLDGQLQLDSDDERPYHESLVHPALALAIDARRALVLGGGDGLVVRELLLDPAVEHVVVVDLDPVMTSLARTLAPLRRLGGGALGDRRVTLVHEDALRWAPAAVARGEQFDVVIVDLPDPSSEVLAPLFAKETFETWARLLSEHGVLSVQAGAPRAAPRAFASIARTIEACGLSVLTLALDAPASFGGTAVALASRRALERPRALRVATRWLDPERLAAGFDSPHARPLRARITTLADPAVLGYLRAAMRAHAGPRS